MGDTAGTQSSAMTLQQRNDSYEESQKRLRQLEFAQGALGAGMSVASFMGTQRNARLAMRAAKVESQSIGRANIRRLGAMRARYGASGVTMEGSPLESLADQAMEGALEVELAKYAGEVEKARQRQAGIQAIASGVSSLAGGLAAYGAMQPPAGANTIQLPAAQSSGSYMTGAGTVLQPGVGQMPGLANSYAPGAGTVLQPGYGVGRLW